jgi:uncharacterized membrane protein
VVEADIDTCYRVATDIEAYGQWVDSLTSVEVLAVDDQGRPETVRFQAEGLGRASRYVLAYDYDGGPYEFGWSMVEGDVTRAITGRYRFHDMTETAASPLTEAEYELDIRLAVFLPGFIKRRVEEKILKFALDGFKERVEGR